MRLVRFASFVLVVGMVACGRESAKTPDFGRTIAAVAGIDIVPTAVSGPYAATPGSSFEVTSVICNHGDTPAGSNDAGLYLATTPNVTTADYLMTTRPVPPLQPGQCHSATTFVSGSGPLPPGGYYLGLIGDVLNQLAEGDETNNALAGATIAIGLGPDLVLTAISGPYSAQNGQSITVEATVCNRGTQSAGGSARVNVYTSQNTIIDGVFETPPPSPDALLGTIEIFGSLEPGRCRNGSQQVNAYPGDPYTQGPYYLGGIVDEEGFQSEIIEWNNELTGAQMGIGNASDLVLTAISGPTGAFQGQMITVQATVCNRGTQSAGSANVNVYVSADTDIVPAPSDDALLGTINVFGGLFAGQCRNISGQFNAYAGAPYTDGPYYLGGIADEQNFELELNEGNNEFVGAQLALGSGVDLVLASITGPFSAMPGQPITVTAVVCNHGTQSAGSAGVNVYSSADQNIDSMFDDALLGTLNTSSPLAAGKCATASGTVYAYQPAPYGDGAYYLGGIVDEQNFQPELIETNNELTGGLMGIGFGPDLVVASISAPPSAMFGQAIDVEVSVCNRGTTSAGAGQVNVYLSADTVIEGAYQTPWPSDDSFLGTLTTNGPLNAGQCRSASGVLYANPGAPYTEGSYYLGAIADEQNFQVELDETNNETTGSQMGIGNRADLVITSLTGPSSANQSQQITVDAVVCNQGTQSTGSAQINVYFSADQIIDGAFQTQWPTDDSFVGTISTSGPLQAGQCRMASGQVNAYPGAPYTDGAYYLGAIVDEQGFEFELSEANNELTGALTGIGSGADLVITALSGPPSALQGQQITVEAEVCNRGTQSAGSAEVNVYLSFDQVIDGVFQTQGPSDDSLLGTLSVPGGLFSGQCRVVSGMVNAYSGAPYFDGPYYLGAIADEMSFESELIESNNELTGAQMGIGNGIDLAIASITGPSSAMPGQAIAVSAVVCNYGTQATGGASVNVYLSADQTIDGVYQTPWPSDDSLLGTIYTSSPISAGGCEEATGIVYAYPGAPYNDGPYYLGGIVDENNISVELLETNNELTGAQVGIGNGSDLVITSISGPPSAMFGQQITVEAEVCNRGTAGTGGANINVYLSADTVIDGLFETPWPSDDSLIGTINTNGPLSAGQCRIASGQVYANPGAPYTEGSYYLAAIADEQDFETELIETNNELVGGSMGIGNRPDLVIVSISGPSSANQSQQIEVEAIVCNQGTQAVGTTYVNVYFSADQTIDGFFEVPWPSDDAFVGMINTDGPLSAGQCRTAVGQANAYPGAPYTDGPYYLAGIVDEHDFELELSENNNEFVGALTAIGSGPDLVVTSISGPPSAPQGGSFTVEAVVCNFGTQSTGGADVNVYLSFDPMIDGVFQTQGPSDDSFIGSLSVPGGLFSGQCRAVSGTVYAYSGAPYTDGPYYLGAIVDEQDFENELIESNNELTGAQMGIGNGVDLVIASISGPPSAMQGQNIEVTALICNQGTQSTGSASVNIYLSADAVIEGVFQTPWPSDDSLLGTLTTNDPIMAGGCELATGTVYAYPGAPYTDGVYYLGGIADEQNFESELLENNNEFVAGQMGIGNLADLVITSISGPPSAMFGQQITVEAVVCNQGTTSIGNASVNIYLSADTELEGMFETPWPTDDSLLGTINTSGPLNAGQCRTASGQVYANPGAPYTEGAYYLGGIVDEQDFEVELNESNNELTGGTMGIGNRPDLVITSITGPSSAMQSQQITVQAVVCNRGTTPAGGAQVNVYFSADQTIDGVFEVQWPSDDSLAGSIYTSGPLSAGQCRVASGQVYANPGAPYYSAPYYLAGIVDEQDFEFELDESNNELVGALVGIGSGTDLVVTSITGPAGAMQGQQITVQAEVCNRGTTPTGGADVNVYLSADTVIDGAYQTQGPIDDSLLGTLFVSGGLSPGQCRTTSGQVYAFPGAPFSSGAYYLGAIVDEQNFENELIETNNELTGAQMGIGSGVDLVVASITGPSSAMLGQQITVQALVCNQGTIPTGGANVTVYLSADAAIDGVFQTPWPSDDSLLGTIYVSGGINPGACELASGQVYAYPGAPYNDGAYYLGAIVDEQNFENELIETNNELTGAQMGIGNGVDLVVTSISGPPSAMFGQQVTVEAIVCNRGTTSAGSAQVNVYLSADTNIEGMFQTPWPTDDSLLGSINTSGPLNAGQCRTASGQVYANPGAPYTEGAYYLGAIADEQNFENELVETNNELTGAQMGIGSRADLVITSITGPSSAMQGEQFEVEAVVCNHGTQIAGGAQINVYLSADPILDGVFQTPWPSDDSLIGSAFAGGSIHPGQCRTAVGQVYAFAGAPYTDGPYYLGAIVDEQNFELELIETNNEFTGAQMGIGSRPDLVVASITAPSSAFPGQQISVQALVCNHGTTPASSVSVNVYLSADAVIDGVFQTQGPSDDSLLGSVVVSGGLDAGACSIAAGQVYAYPGAPYTDGPYYLGGIVDEQGFEQELIETNNELIAGLMGIGSGPDLELVSITGPSSAMQGAPFTVDAVVCNRGTQATASASVNVYLSADPLIDGQFQTQWPSDDSLAGTVVTAGPLDAGECEPASGTVYANPGAPYADGGYYLGGIVDEQNFLAELIETNNELTGGLMGIGSGVDLVVTSISGPPSATFGEQIDVEVTLCNQGTQSTGGAGVNVYLSADTTIDGQFQTPWPSDDSLLGTVTFSGPLDPGTCATESELLNANPGAPYTQGGYYFGAIADEQNFQPELIEANNELTGGLIGLGTGPDLIVTSVSGPPFAMPGGNFQVDTEVCNQGNQSSSPTNLGIYLSADEEIDEDDQLVAMRPVPALLPDECDDDTTMANAGGLGLGVYRLGAIADADEFVPELIEINNALAGDTLELAWQFCGDGSINGPGEQCDDGNFSSGDGCTSNCQDEYCGDGVVNDGGAEECDDGNSDDGDGCSAVCVIEFCGDGVVNNGGTEECDDGNTSSFDGCSSACLLETIIEPWRENANGTQQVNVAYNYAMGYHFTPQANGAITALGGFFNGTKTVRLFNRTTGVQLAEAVVTAANTWGYTAITPVNVTAGTSYTVAVYLAGSGASYRTGIQTLPRTYGQIRIDASTYASTASNPTARPTNSITTVMYGQADIRYAGPPVPPPPPGQASYDSTYRCPRCSTIGNNCDSNTLLVGRATLGPEPNQPNTINNSCADGTSGSFHSDESLDRLRVYTLSGSSFAPGQTVRIEATVWAFSTGTSDYLDLYYTTTPSTPSWTYITTRQGTAGGQITLTADLVLPAGAPIMAIRGQWRYTGGATNPGVCYAGGYNDRDDLVFAVGP